MLEKLPIEVLFEIYKNISPEEAPVFALVSKFHKQYISNVFWEKKFELHFEYLLKDLPKEENRNWYVTFRKVYDREYTTLKQKTQRDWFSFVKEGKSSELKGLSLEDLYLKDKQGKKLLEWAIEKSHQHILDYFWQSVVVPAYTKNGLLISEKLGPYKRTILHWAATLNQYKNLESLLAIGEFNINALTSLNCTALHEAAREGHTDIVRLLLKKGSSINARSKSGATALLLAIENNHPEIVDVLLEGKADTSITLQTTTSYHSTFKVVAGDTPLHAAAKGGHANILKKLMIGANIHALNSSNNTTALHNAAREGHADIVRLLLKNDSSINARSKSGATALLFAIENNHPEIVDVLLEGKADTSITLQTTTSYHSTFKVVAGDTPLHAAAKGGHANILKKLMIGEAFNKNIKTLNSEQETPLDVVKHEVKPLLALENYSTQREMLSGDFKIFTLFCMRFERTFTFFGHRFGCTKQEKLDAVSALKKVIYTSNNKEDLENLKQHKKALENGKLGSIYQDLRKYRLIP
jgi:ankyrin repeat protein